MAGYFFEWITSRTDHVCITLEPKYVHDIDCKNIECGTDTVLCACRISNDIWNMKFSDPFPSSQYFRLTLIRSTTTLDHLDPRRVFVCFELCIEKDNRNTLRKSGAFAYAGCPTSSKNIYYYYDIEKSAISDDFQNRTSFNINGKLIFLGYDCPTTDINIFDSSTPDLVADLKRLYKESHECDVTFCLNGGDIRAHKCILSTRSAVFRSIFDKETAEKANNGLPIDDIDLHVFDCFLLFLYTGEIKDKSWDTVLGMYAAAAKYQVQSLQKICATMLSSNLTADNVCDILVKSEMYGDFELKDTTKEFLLGCFKQVASTKPWVDIIAKFPALATEVLSFITASSTR